MWGGTDQLQKWAGSPMCCRSHSPALLQVYWEKQVGFQD